MSLVSVFRLVPAHDNFLPSQFIANCAGFSISLLAWIGQYWMKLETKMVRRCWAISSKVGGLLRVPTTSHFLRLAPVSHQPCCQLPKLRNLRCWKYRSGKLVVMNHECFMTLCATLKERFNGLWVLKMRTVLLKATKIYFLSMPLHDSARCKKTTFLSRTGRLRTIQTWTSFIWTTSAWRLGLRGCSSGVIRTLSKIWPWRLH